ncbi:MAG: hypothetical protein ACRD0U_11265 [Acidimicrobiales bacterium]
MSRRFPALVFGLWTLLVWIGRVRNVWSDEASTAAKLGATFLALSFVILALVALVGVWQDRRWGRAAVAALAAWTVVVWVPRAALILGRDHSVKFKVVHVALATVSVGLALWAVRTRAGDSTRSPARFP